MTSSPEHGSDPDLTKDLSHDHNYDNFTNSNDFSPVSQDQEMYHTPRKSRLSSTTLLSGQSAQQQSLAFELAAAMSPDDVSTSQTLLEELGIAADPTTSMSPGDCHSATSEMYDYSTETASSPQHSSSIKPKKSFAGSFLMKESLSPENSELDAANASLSHTVAKLKEIVEDTNRFLEKIRLLANSDSTTQTSSSLSSPTTDVYPQSVMEQQANDLVWKMADSLKTRNSQIRELREILRQLQDMDDSIVCQLEDLDLDSSYYYYSSTTTTATATAAATSTTMTLNTVLPRLPEEDETVLEDSESTTILTTPNNSTSLSKSPSSTTSKQSTITAELTALEHLAQLRHLTSQLINTMVILDEQVQLSRGVSSDADRRLRSLRGLVNGLRSDIDSVEQSKSFIRSWERKVEAWSGSLGRGYVAKTVYQHKEQIGQLLIDAETRAKALLTVEG